MGKQGGLVAAYLLDGKGGGRLLDWQALGEWRPDDGFLWVHLDRRAKESRRWLREESGIAPAICETLLSEEGMRPRCRTIAENALVILRGVNLNPGANPDDMVAIRLWIEPHRAISLRHRRVMAIQELRNNIEAGQGPCNAGDFLADTASKLAFLMGPCPSSKHSGRLSLLRNGGSGSSWIDVKLLCVDGSSGGFGLSVSLSFPFFR